MARIPGIDAAFAAVQAQAAGLLSAQTEALAQLPDVVASLTGAVRGLVETAQQARESIASFQRLTARMDGIVAELEEPLRALAPGLRRLAVVLDDPVVADLPDTLRRVQDDVLPVLRTLADTHDKVAVIAGSTDRIMGLVEETSRTFSGLPGAGLLGRRRPQPPAATVVVVEQDPPERS